MHLYIRHQTRALAHTFPNTRKPTRKKDTVFGDSQRVDYCCGHEHQTDKKQTRRKTQFCSNYNTRHQDLKQHNHNSVVDGRPCHEIIECPTFTMAEVNRRNQIAVPVRSHPDEPEIHSENQANSVRLTPARTGQDRKTQVKWKDTLVEEQDMHLFDITHPDNVARNLSCTTGRPRLRPVAKIKSETSKVSRPVDAVTQKEPWEEFVNMYKAKLAIRNAYSLALQIRTWDPETGYIEDKPEKWDKSIFHWPQITYQGYRYKFGPVRLLIEENSPNSCPIFQKKQPQRFKINNYNNKDNQFEKTEGRFGRTPSSRQDMQRRYE